MNSINKINAIGVLIALISVFFMSMLFIVEQQEEAIVLRFKKVEQQSNDDIKIYLPGLHFKLPFIDEVHKFDMRLNLIDIQKSRITTQEKKDVIVSYYVKWKIDNIYTYYRRTRGIRSIAESLLEQKVNSTLKIEVGRLTIAEVVSGERNELMSRTLTTANDNAAELGVKVIDVRVKAIDLPDEVSESVYTRMRAERERKANEFRAEGEKEATWLRAEAQKKYNIILAEAAKNVSVILGQAEARAMEIYSVSHSKSPEFHAFLRSMDAYKASFASKQDVLVLKPDSDFFKHFNNK